MDQPGGLFLNGLMVRTLYELTTVEFELEAREATRIEFTRMRRATETETRREEKVEREPPPAAPDVPQLSLSSSSVDTNMISLAPTIDTAGALAAPIFELPKAVKGLRRIDPDARAKLIEFLVGQREVMSYTA